MSVSQAKLLGGSCSEGSGSGFAGFIEKKYPRSQGRTAEGKRSWKDLVANPMDSLRRSFSRAIRSLTASRRF